MENYISIILVIFATIINSIVFGYVASNSKNNKINISYLIFLTFIIFYTIFDCIIIQIFNSIEIKNIIVKIQAMFWMPLPILFLNFIYLFLRKPKDELFNIFLISTIASVFFTLFSNNVLIGYKGFNLGTMAYTGTWFLPTTFIGIIPAAVYGIFLIGREGKIFNFQNNELKNQGETLFTKQLKIIFIGSTLCLLIAVTTNIFFDEVLGYSGELHLASLTLSIQSIFILPALIKYNFLNQPIEKLGDELYENSPDSVFVINSLGIILNLNKSARKMFNLKGKITDQGIKSLFEDKYDFSSDHDNFETKTIRGDHITISQTNISKGSISMGKILVIRDISQRKRAEEKLKKSEESYKYLIKSSGDIIYNLDVKGKFTFVNPKFEKITGYSRDEVLGQDTNFLVKKDYKDEKTKIFSQLYIKKSKNLQQSTKTEVAIITKKGKTLWMELGISTIVKNNEISGFSIIARNITDRRSAENKLLKTTKELTTAQEVAGLGSFTYDIIEDKVTWSDKLYNLYEKNKHTFTPTKEKFFNEVVHPDSREFSIQIVNEALENKLKELDYVHKTLLPNGDEKWMEAKIKIIYDKNNQPIRMNGTSQNVTELHTISLNLEKSERRLKTAIEIAKLGTWEENHETGIIYWSPILKKMFDIKEKTDIGKNVFWDLVHPEDVDWMKTNWKKAEKEQLPYTGTFRIQLKNGDIKHLNEHAEFIIDSGGKLLKTIGTVIDMTELQKYQQELRQLSSHIQELQEEERGRIAREIHDELGQRLTSMNMDISFLKNKQESSSKKEINERLTALNKLVEETIKMTRKLSQELRPSILDDLGLMSAIDWLKEQYKLRSDIQFTLDFPKNEIEIDNEHATAIFRITQEALTNIIKHSKAKNVIIQIKQNDSNITLKIQDDGGGIEPSQITSNGKTYGVFGMKERANHLGGKLVINNNSLKGTTVNLTIPYKDVNQVNT